jgi:hypothetical protein
MSKVSAENRVVSVSHETLVEAHKAFSDIMDAKGVSSMENRVSELSELLGKGSVVSVGYNRVIEWRNVLGCYGYVDVEKKLNFPFQYHI